MITLLPHFCSFYERRSDSWETCTVFAGKFLCREPNEFLCGCEEAFERFNLRYYLQGSNYGSFDYLTAFVQMASFLPLRLEYTWEMITISITRLKVTRDDILIVMYVFEALSSASRIQMSSYGESWICGQGDKESAVVMIWVHCMCEIRHFVTISATMTSTHKMMHLLYRAIEQAASLRLILDHRRQFYEKKKTSCVSQL